MAVDLSLLDSDGQALDMGTVFDFLAENPDAAHNPAHRDHPQTEAVQSHRDILDRVMLEGEESRTGAFSSSAEWWDYRLPTEFFIQYAPLSEADLPRIFGFFEVFIS